MRKRECKGAREGWREGGEEKGGRPIFLPGLAAGVVREQDRVSLRDQVGLQPYMGTQLPCK